MKYLLQLERIIDVYDILRSSMNISGDILYIAYMGSRAYNLHNEDSDIDLLVCFKMPLSSIAIEEFNPRHNNHAIQSIVGKYDITAYSAQRYLRDAILGRYSVIDSIHANESEVLYSSLWFDQFIQADEFVTKKYINSLVGVATSIIESQKLTNKNLYIAMRLCFIAENCMKSITYLTPDQIDVLRTIKYVPFNRDELDNLRVTIEHTIKRLKAMIVTSNLPDRVNDVYIQHIHEQLHNLYI